MRYRLYLDETGIQDITNTHDENNRYFSLCGAILDLNLAGGDATNYMNQIKSEFFTHDPDDPLILHREEIMNRIGPFGSLKDAEVDDKFQRWLIKYLKVIQYKAICVVIDKRAMLKHDHWQEKNPYHYCIQVMLEKYVQWLERNDVYGDVIAERRGKKEDRELEKEYARVVDEGAFYISSEKIQDRLIAKKIENARQKRKYYWSTTGRFDCKPCI